MKKKKKYSFYERFLMNSTQNGTVYKKNQQKKI